MNKITHMNATTVQEAVDALGANAAVIAGGTDIFNRLKAMAHPEPPEELVNIKTIPGLDYIKEEGGLLKIGALTTLTSIYESPIVQGKYPALAEAARKMGSLQLRNMGTIGGNLCQETWCWYFRAEHNAFYCLRKGGTTCQAIPGDNRFNAIIGYSVCPSSFPSDTAIPLAALQATIVTNARNIPIGDFFSELGNDLNPNEIVTEIQVPEPQAGTKQAFIKVSVRKAIDFAIASVATAITVEGGSVTDARIILGGVAPVPYRATAAEDALKGKAISESVAETAGAAAVNGAKPLSNNAYIVPMAKGLVKKAILA